MECGTVKANGKQEDKTIRELAADSSISVSAGRGGVDVVVGSTYGARVVKFLMRRDF